MYSFQMGSAQLFHQNSIIFSEVFLSFGATEIYHMYIGNPPPPSTKMCGKVLFSGFLWISVFNFNFFDQQVCSSYD